MGVGFGWGFVWFFEINNIIGRGWTRTWAQITCHVLWHFSLIEYVCLFSLDDDVGVSLGALTLF